MFKILRKVFLITRNSKEITAENPYSADDGADCISWNICSVEDINGKFFSYSNQIPY